MLGRTIGTITTCIVVVQYVPQMVTTCRLRGPGSLSIALMAIQAPGGTLNALFMWLAQGDDWTTWISIEAASVQMFILLANSSYFKCRAWRERKARQGEQKSLSGSSDEGDRRQRLLDEVAEPPEYPEAAQQAQSDAEAKHPPVVFVDQATILEQGEAADRPESAADV
jgi:uncharacterized protein with PQ loop repeat